MSKRFIPLTPKQRGYLALLAKTAHSHLTSKGAIDEPFDVWRKYEAMQASSGFTISKAPRRCFDDLEQHFLALAGKSGAAFDRATGPDNESRQIAHEISVAAKTAGVTDGYVSGICRRMFRGRDHWDTATEGRKVLIAVKQLARRKQSPAT